MRAVFQTKIQRLVGINLLAHRTMFHNRREILLLCHNRDFYYEKAQKSSALIQTRFRDIHLRIEFTAPISRVSTLIIRKVSLTMVKADARCAAEEMLLS